MPIPKITQQILASTKPLLDGWSLVTLDGIRTQTKDGAVNTWFDFVVESGPQDSTDNSGKKTSFLVSGNGLDQGIDSLCRAYVQLLSALTGLSGEEVKGADIADEYIVGKKVYAKIGKRMQGDTIYPDFQMFAPASIIPW